MAPPKRCKSCPILGTAKKLPLNMLPTIEEILNYFTYLQNSAELKYCAKQKLNGEVVKILTNNIQEIWAKAGIPIYRRSRIMCEIRKYHSLRQQLLKSYGRDSEQQTMKIKIKLFLVKVRKLFDISNCKCDLSVRCYCGIKVLFLRNIPNKLIS